MFRKFIAFLIAIMMFICCSLSCAAIDFDGKPHNSEWEIGETLLFENPESFNNSIDFAYMKVITDLPSNQLHLCIGMHSLQALESTEASAITVTFNKGSDIVLKGDGTSEYNVDDYGIDFGVTYDEETRYIFYEIRFGVKNGIPSKNLLSVVLTDSQAVPSNVFDFEFDFSQNTTTSVTSTKTTKVKATKKTTTKKSAKTDSFTFNKAEINQETNSLAQATQASETTVVNLTQNVIDSNSRNKKIYTALAVICASALAVSAVYSGIRKSKQSSKEK